MNIKPDIEVIFEFTGSRNIFEGYRPAHLIRSDYLTTGIHNYYRLNDDENKITGSITFISPKEYPGCMWIGKRIPMYEGGTLVGYATVTKILNSVLGRKHFILLK